MDAATAMARMKLLDDLICPSAARAISFRSGRNCTICPTLNLCISIIAPAGAGFCAELPRCLARSLPHARRIKEDFSSSYGRCRVPFLTSLFSHARLSSGSAGFHSRANFCASAICAVVIPSDNKSTNLVKSK